MADELPPGVRGEVVAALLTPLSDGEWREAAWNATQQERQFAGKMAGQFAEMRSHQAAAILWLMDALGPYWRDPSKTLMDVIADAPPHIRGQAVKILDVFDP